MEEMSEQDRQTRDAARARRKRIAEGVFRVFGLLGGLFWLLVFVTVVRTGYLSLIGIIAGALLTVPAIAGPVAGLAGWKRLEKLWSWIWIGTIVLIAVAAVLILVWPEDHETWRPYRFEEDLAALEAERSVPDADNAALRYESVLTTEDVSDRPEFLFDGEFSLHWEFSTNPWKAENYPRVSEWLDSHAETIHGLLQIGNIERCRWPLRPDDGGEYTVPHKRMFRGAQLLLAAANHDLGEGRIRQAIEAYCCLLRQADHLCQQTDQLDFMYGRRPEGSALRMIRYVLTTSELSREDIERIIHCLPAAVDTWRRDISNLVEFDKVRFARMMAWAYEINEQGKVRFAASFQPLAKKGQENSSRKRLVARGRRSIQTR